ncbi:MAG: porin family protein [Saprospiraceae bacterium]|nr:porin family protein [Saprospiraceae bacterium]
MKKNFILLIALLPFLVFAQNAEYDSLRHIKFGVGLLYTADWSHQAKPIDYLVSGFEGPYGLTQSGAFGQQIGVSFDVKFNEKWSLISGLIWNNRRFHEKITSSPGTGTYAKTHTIGIDYLSIPFGVQYTIKKSDRIKLLAELGIIYDKNMNDELTDSYANLILKPRGWSIFGAFGAAYDINKKSILEIKPIFRFAMSKYGESSNSGVNNPPADFKPYSLGLAINYKILIN